MPLSFLLLGCATVSGLDNPLEGSPLVGTIVKAEPTSAWIGDQEVEGNTFWIKTDGPRAQTVHFISLSNCPSPEATGDRYLVFLKSTRSGVPKFVAASCAKVEKDTSFFSEWRN